MGITLLYLLVLGVGGGFCCMVLFVSLSSSNIFFTITVSKKKNQELLDS